MLPHHVPAAGFCLFYVLPCGDLLLQSIFRVSRLVYEPQSTHDELGPEY